MTTESPLLGRVAKAITPVRRRVAQEVLHRAHHLEVDPTSEAQLDWVSNFLKKHPNFNFVGYFNHNAYADPGLFAYLFLTRIDQERRLAYTMPASDWHLFIRNNHYFAPVVKLGSAMLDYTVLPTVQDYMVNDEKYVNQRTGNPYSQSDRTGINLTSFKKMKRLIRSGQAVAAIVAPEETRGKLDKMQRAQPGLESLVRDTLVPCVVLPIGFSYRGDHGRGINLFSTVDAFVADPFVVDSAESAPSLDQMMYRLAGVLPKNLRGVYTNPPVDNV